ncbi:MAG TPA: iron-containing alcohol dehydrogenase [Anaerolineae bacterium]|nr:iron-containing alcohol dehydrogenase [Anaerolineae bacterium]
MSVEFEFATAARVVFGAGSLAQLGPAAAALGGRALLVTGRDVDRALPAAQVLRAAGIAVQLWSVSGEPGTADVEAGVLTARAGGCDLVVAIGGGSPLDAGKAIAALLTNDGPPLDYLEVVGRGRALEREPAPFIAVPTTAGTGSEVTRNAVLTASEQRVKVSLRSPKMLPRLAIVDPLLTLSLPPGVTADCGLDALTQCLEPLVSNRGNPITDGLAREGLGRASRSLRRAWADGGDLEARTQMCAASLLGGMALANAALGAVHGLAGPIGGMFPAPHGAVSLPDKAPVKDLASRPVDNSMSAFRRELDSLTYKWPNCRSIANHEPHPSPSAGPHAAAEARSTAHRASPPRWQRSPRQPPRRIHP